MMVITLMLISLDSRKLGLNSRCETSLAKLAKDVVKPNLTHLRSNVKNVRPLNKAHGLRDYMLDYAYEVSVSSQARIDVEPLSKVNWFANVLVKCQGLLIKDDGDNAYVYYLGFKDALVRKLGLNSRCEASLEKLAKDVSYGPMKDDNDAYVMNDVRPWNKAHGLRDYMLDYAYEVSVSSRARINVEPPSNVNWFVNVLVKFQDMTMEEYIQYKTEKALKMIKYISGKLLSMERSTILEILTTSDFLKQNIVYDDALSSQHVDGVNWKNETSLSEYDDGKYNAISENVLGIDKHLFSYDIFSIDNLKLDKDDDEGKIGIKQSLGDIFVEPLHNGINTDVDTYAHVLQYGVSCNMDTAY
ncbi:hypothetical protein Tco_0912003 [Tanacetum coccineum]